MSRETQSAALHARDGSATTADIQRPIDWFARDLERRGAAHREQSPLTERVPSMATVPAPIRWLSNMARMCFGHVVLSCWLLAAGFTTRTPPRTSRRLTGNTRTRKP
jgi:hypothetical protein